MSATVGVMTRRFVLLGDVVASRQVDDRRRSANGSPTPARPSPTRTATPSTRRSNR